MNEKWIAIFPYAARLRDGNVSPKNYPYWEELVSLLKQEGFKIVQISRSSEDKVIGVDLVAVDLPLEQIAVLCAKCVTYISVDSFAPHLLHFYLIQGIVIFALSDPLIFGYDTNINVLKGRQYLRNQQYLYWSVGDYNTEAFERPEKIAKIITTLKIKEDGNKL